MSEDAISRRRWLGAGLSGALVLAGATPAAAQGTRRARIGLLGVPEDSRAPTVTGGGFPDLDLAIAAVWDPERSRARDLADSLPGAKAVAGPDSMDVDAVVVSDHRAIGSTEKLLQPYLKRGVPAWIEGPLAYSMAAARRLAGDAKGPLASACIEELLPMAVSLGRLARKFAPVTAGFGQINTAERAAHRWAGFEAVAFALAVFGGEARSATRLASGEEDKHYAYVLEYGGERPIHVIVHGLPGGEHLAWGRFYGTSLADRGHPSGLPADEVWIATRLPAVLALQRMIRTGEAPQSASVTLRKTQLYLTGCYASTRGGGQPVDTSALPESWEPEDPFPSYWG